MIHLVTLLVTVLMALQCSLEVNAQIDRKLDLDNNLQSNVIPTPKRRLKKFLVIWEAPPETVRHEPGTTTEITCEVMGHPAPSIQWLKNGESMADYEQERIDMIPTHPSSVAQLLSKLIITTASPGDVYTCVATAGLKQKTASTTVYTDAGDDDEKELLTLEKLYRKSIKPVITDSYVYVFQDIGTDIVLPCRVTSNTKSQVFWEDNEDNLIYGNSRMKVLPSGDLLIADLRWGDLGNFTCNAKNLFGKDSTVTYIYPVNKTKA